METVSDSSPQLSVRQEEPTLVPPAKPTNKGSYFLSNLDQSSFVVRSIYGFKSDVKSHERATRVIKNALSQVLVHYYPLAGRLTLNSDGKLVVDCTGEAAVFVAAEANCAIEAIGDITTPTVVTLGKLVYDSPSAESVIEIHPLVTQVRRSSVLFISHSLCLLSVSGM